MRIFLLFFIFCFINIFVSAQPANDLCSGAFTLTPNATCTFTAGTSNGATDNNETGDCTGGTEKAVWYKFVASQSTATVSVGGALGYDAVIGANSSCGSSSRPTGGTCTDFTGDGEIETMNLSGLTIGNTYYIQVYDYYGVATAAATFDICIVSVPPPTCPTGLGAGTVTVASLPYDSGTGQTTCGNGNNITSSNAIVCGSTSYYGGEDVTYIFTPAVSGVHTITLTQATNYYAGIMLYNGCPFLGSGSTCVGNTQSLSGTTRVLSPNLTMGVTYYLVADNYPSPACMASYQLKIDPPTACPTPLSVSSNTVTSNSANITWTCTGCTGSYIIEYGSPSFVPGTGGSAGSGTTVTSAGSPAAITGLTASTSYDVYVRQDCTGASSGYGNNSTKITFTTNALPPGNDDCSGATAFGTVPTDGSCITLSSQSTAGATASGVTPSGACTSTSGTADDDVWFSFVAPATTVILSATWVSGVTDVYWHVFSSSCASSMTSILCTDTNTGGTLTGLTIGNTYYIRLYTYSSSVSTVQDICLKTPPPAPGNDDCSGATAFGTVPTDGSCITLSSQSTAGATASGVTPSGACTSTSGTADDDVWFSFVAPASSVILSGTWVSGVTDVYWHVFSGTCASSMTSIFCTDTDTGGTLTGLTIGNTYYIRLYTYSSSVSTVQNICLKTPPPPPTCPTGLGVGTVTVVSIPYDSGTGQTTCGNGNNITSSNATVCGSSSFYGGEDKTYIFTPTVSGVHTITLTQATNYYAGIMLYDGCPFLGSGGSCVGFTQSYSAAPVVLSPNLTMGVTYYLVADNYPSPACMASYQLKIDPPPANDLCADATPFPIGVGGSITGTTVSANNEESSVACNSKTLTTGDVWYKIVTDNDAVIGEQLVITLSPNGSEDYAIYLYSGGCGSLIFEACADATSSGPEVIMFTVANGFTGHDQSGSRNNDEFYVRVKQSGTASGGFTLTTSGSALPISISNISAQNMGKNNMITWTTASEVNNDVQIVERSKDGVSRWEEVSKVKGTNTREKTTYEVYDNNPHNTTFYRVHSVDFDGKEQFSKIISVQRDGKRGIINNIQPNPTSNFVQIDLQAEYDDDVIYTIFDATGKLLKTSKFSAPEGVLSTHTLDMSDLQTGLYFVSIKGGGISQNAKIFKQ